MRSWFTVPPTLVEQMKDLIAQTPASERRTLIVKWSKPIAHKVRLFPRHQSTAQRRWRAA